MRLGQICGWTILLLLAALFAHPAGAQTGSVAVGSQAWVALSPSFEYYEDSSAQLTLDAVRERDRQGQFAPVARSGSTTNFGSTNSAIWLRVHVHTALNSPAHWLLEIANPPLDRLDLYASNAQGGFDHQTGGDSLPFAERQFPHRNHVKPIALVPGTTTTLYLRVASQGTVSAPSALWQADALWQNDQKTYSIFSLYFGLLLGLLLYNLLLFLSVRDPSYLIYVVFVACVGFSQAANSGLGAQFLWPEALWWNSNSINTANAASGAFGMLFARSFLSSRTTLPALDRWMRVQVGLWGATCLLTFFVPYKISVWAVTGLIPLGLVTVVLAGALSILRRHPGAPYFGLAWGVFFVGVITLTLHNNGFLPSNPLTANAVLIGSALEMVLLSFALADRINEARREKLVAQAAALSEQARAQALQQSQEHYSAVIEHVAEGMVVVKDERIVFVNFRATEILETSKEAIIDSGGVVQRVHPDDQAVLVQRVRSRFAGLPVPERCEIRLQREGKAPKWLEVGENLVPWDGGQGVLMFFLDVTQRHTAEQEIRTALARQQELNALRSRFVAMTSHEFRTPLATILSSQDLLQHYGPRMSEAKNKELLQSIATGVHRMTGMLDRVLLLGKADAQMLEFKPQALDLQALCDALLTEAKNQLPGSPCVVSMEYLADTTKGVYDEKLLRHIFGNLLSNAIKYSPAGGEVRMKVHTVAAQTVFEVSDQGIGIPADEIADLFESFHRASNVGAIAGTGLGLAIVKQSVDLHGGHIAVRSQAAQGTTFTVTL